MSTFDVMMARTSVRCYQPDPVKEEDVKKSAKAAIWAPNGMNSRQ